MMAKFKSGSQVQVQVREHPLQGEFSTARFRPGGRMYKFSPQARFHNGKAEISVSPWSRLKPRWEEVKSPARSFQWGQFQAIHFHTHCTLHTAHCTLHTAHCTLHTTHCTLSSFNRHFSHLPVHLHPAKCCVIRLPQMQEKLVANSKWYLDTAERKW